jgi:hypothetical protein
MPAHRVLAQDQLPSDCRVAQPLRDELQHVDFASRQHRSSSGRRWIAKLADEGTSTLGFALGLHVGERPMSGARLFGRRALAP